MTKHASAEVDITVDHVFAGYIFPLSGEELELLEQNIVEHGGARDPLVVWASGDKNILLDGHNRYAICTRLGLPFSVERREFADREAAEDWVDRNQLGRRNLSKQDYKILLGRRYNRAKRAEHDGGKGKKRSGGQTDHHSDTTAERLAREHGVGEATVRRAGKLQAAAAKLGIEKEIAAGTIKPAEAAVVSAAAALPAAPSPEQLEQAREQVRQAPPRKAKGKPAAAGDKPIAADARRKNSKLAERITIGLISVRAAVEELAQTDSTFRDSTLVELNRCVEHLSQPRLAPKGKPEKREPTDDLRAAVAERWEAMRLWGKRWGIADMKDVRRLFAEIIRDEQKRFDK